MLPELNPSNAWIFRITHIQNIPWILANGLHCKNSDQRDPNFETIGNLDLISKRNSRMVPIQPGGTLSDYIPFYFTPLSPMMYNIHTGWGGIRKVPNPDIVIMVSSLHNLNNLAVKYVYTDRHAYLKTARFFSSLADINQLDWPRLKQRDFKYDPDNPEKLERYQAEALVHRFLPVGNLTRIACYSGKEKKNIDKEMNQFEVDLPVEASPRWYF